MSHDHDDHAHPTTANGDAGESDVIPPEPASRFISPAAADFAQTPPASLLAWPVVWILVIGLLGYATFRAARANGFHDRSEHAAGH